VCVAASCAVRSIVQQCALRSTQQDESRKKTTYMCHATIKRAALKKCIANIVQRSILAAVRPSQVKPSAAESGGTAQRRAQRQAGVLRSVQQSMKPFRRCVRSGKRFRRCVRSGKLRSAQHCTTVRIAQYPARRVAQENDLHVPCDHKARSIKKVHR
jgi:hypothetical protein